VSNEGNKMAKKRRCRIWWSLSFDARSDILSTVLKYKENWPQKNLIAS